MKLFSAAWGAPLLAVSLMSMAAMPAQAATRATTAAAAKPAMTRVAMKQSHKPAKRDHVAKKTAMRKAPIKKAAAHG